MLHDLQGGTVEYIVTGKPIETQKYVYFVPHMHTRMHTHAYTHACANTLGIKQYITIYRYIAIFITAIQHNTA